MVAERRAEADPFAALGAMVKRAAGGRAARAAALLRRRRGLAGLRRRPLVREAARPQLPDELGLPEACFVLTDTVVIFDNLRGTMKVVASVDVGRRRSRPGLRRRLRPHRGGAGSHRQGPGPGGVAAAAGRDAAARRPACPSRVARTSQADYEAGVRRIQEYIKAGDAFQVVLSQRFDVPRQGVDPFDVYRLLRVTNPSPYMFHLEFPEAVVTGASPECLVRLDGRKVEVRPIAGTRRAGPHPEEDAALEAELRQDEKERPSTSCSSTSAATTSAGCRRRPP